MKVKELLSKLKAEDIQEVREAVEQLRDYESPEVIKALVDLAISRKNRAILEAVKETLINFKNSTVCKEVIELFNTSEPKLRQTAIEILSYRGNECIPFVKKHLICSKDSNMRKFALDILSNINTESALEELAQLLNDPDVNVRMTALEYLRNFSSFKEKVVELIVKTIPYIEDMYGLTTLASTVIYGELKDSKLIKPLREMLNKFTDPLEKHWIYKTLLFLGDKEILREAVENAKEAEMEEDIRKDIEIFGS